MITVNNNYGGTVVINDTPQEWRKGWAKRLFKFFGIYCYISNTRMKKRPKRDMLFTGYREHIHTENKKKLYERQGGGMFGVRSARGIQGYRTSPCFALLPLS